MPTNTYVALYQNTLLSNTSVVNIDTSAITDYNDLVLVVNNGTSLSGNSLRLNFDGVTTSLYSNTYMLGNGSSIGGSAANQGGINIGDVTGSSDTSVQISNIIHIPNFRNNKEKTILYRVSNGGNTQLGAGLYRSTSAITTINLRSTNGDLTAGTTISVYGIAGAGTSPAAKATGGVIYSDSTYYYHVFGSSGVFTPTQSISADLLMIGGGGSGSVGKTGTYYGSGAGAGQVLNYTAQSLTATNYTVTIGGGGSPLAGSTLNTNGNAGTATQFTGLTSASGGGGGLFDTGTGGTSGNGFAGGSPSGAACGGGGGSGAVGGNAGSPAGGNGGNGTTSYGTWLSATGLGRLVSGSYYIAGGGAGSYPNGYGGYGGGGGDPLDYTAATQAGKVNTGSGGAAGNYSSTASGAGGSGVVIVRYLKA